VGKKLVRRQGLILVLAIAVACGQPKQTMKPAAAGGPQVRATVVTIRTTIQPANKTYTHALMIANGRARSGDEVDAWRLFDLQKKQVTFVDDIARTYRTVPLDVLAKRHDVAFEARHDPQLPRAQWIASGAKRVVAGVEATQALVRMGAYQRELWIGRHPSIPDELYAVMRVSETAPSPIAGVADAVDDALVKMRGFPMSDHAELPYGDAKKLVVDRAVVSVEQKDVPASWLNVPANYRDLTAPAASRRPAS
jgi:hypothetical protein